MGSSLKQYELEFKSMGVEQGVVKVHSKPLRGWNWLCSPETEYPFLFNFSPQTKRMKREGGGNI